MDELRDWGMPWIVTNIAPFAWTIPRVDRIEGYDYASGDQRYLVEVWVEKSTVDDVLRPICLEWDVNLVSSIGFQSISSVITLLKRITEMNKPTRIFYISDFDPAGDSMPVSVARQLEYWLHAFAPGAEIKLTPLVLTRAQVIAYQLPRIPIKESDRRRQHFEERYGEGAVELDALEALYPGTLGAVVREAIRPYRDPTLPERLSAVEDVAMTQARAQWQAQTAELIAERNELFSHIDEIASRYRERLEVLNDELQADLDPFRERLDTLRHAIETERSRFRPALPDRPGPDIADVDESDWLFDSRRDYLAQMSFYKARRDIPPGGESEVDEA